MDRGEGGVVVAADGVVAEILVDDGQPVQFGQVLFRIDTGG